MSNSSSPVYPLPLLKTHSPIVSGPSPIPMREGCPRRRGGGRPGYNFDMTTTPDVTTDVRWSLSDLYSGMDDPRIPDAAD